MFKKVCNSKDVPLNGGATVLVDGEQIAIFAYDNGATWYAVQNLCPHKQQMCLSRGIIGDTAGKPKVACPLHKHTFGLDDGKHLGGNAEWTLKTWVVKVENGEVLLDL